MQRAYVSVPKYRCDVHNAFPFFIFVVPFIVSLLKTTMSLPPRVAQPTPGTVLRIIHETDHDGRKMVEKITTDQTGKTYITQYRLYTAEIQALLTRLSSHARVEHVRASSQAHVSPIGAMDMMDARSQPQQTKQPQQSQQSQQTPPPQLQTHTKNASGSSPSWQTQFNPITPSAEIAPAEAPLAPLPPELSSNAPSHHAAYQRTHDLKYGSSPSRRAHHPPAGGHPPTVPTGVCGYGGGASMTFSEYSPVQGRNTQPPATSPAQPGCPSAR